MKFDGTLDIAIGHSRNSKTWKNQKWKWSDFLQRISEEHKTNETYKEYMAATKEEQSQIKDVGGYVGAYLRNGKRSPSTVVHRQLLTLDIDFAYVGFWEDFILQFSNAAIVHSTHKHHKDNPRLRLLIPLSRAATPDEYVAVARKIAGDFDIEIFDNTTFETNRLMYWPSTPRDIEYYFRYQDGSWVDVDQVLAQYNDWTDSSLWPTATQHLDRVKTAASKQQDPTQKKGPIGAFCRAYGVGEAIETFLSDVYQKEDSGRFTYLKGTTSSGMIVYEDTFAFSHHGTDPAGGRLCNAFDLVRIHKFGTLDKGPEAKESYSAMVDLLLTDPKVKGAIAKDKLESAQYDFTGEFGVDEEDLAWMEDLEIDAKGGYKSSAHNLNLIFRHDRRLAGVLRYNEFYRDVYVMSNLPWRKVEKAQEMRNVDISGLRNYVEVVYGIVGAQKIEDAFLLAAEENSFHPIQQYLRPLIWDNRPRVDTLLVDYFGAEDSVYTREAIRKTLVAAVTRVFRPGAKFDMVLTLVGPQGTGKSTFVDRLAGPWFSDTFTTVQGKEAYEQLQGAWIIEIAELSGLKKAEVEHIKHFITKREDSFRAAFARKKESNPRQCIFIGTTNTVDFLRDYTGNRRFNPVTVIKGRSTKSVFGNLTQEEVDQIWAEAYHLFKKGEPLVLSNKASIVATRTQEAHTERDDRLGWIESYVELDFPEDWDELGLEERRVWLQSPLSKKGSVQKQFICAAEVWCELMGHPYGQMESYKTRQLNSLLRLLPGWEPGEGTRTFPIYGRQRFYQRTLS